MGVSALFRRLVSDRVTAIALVLTIGCSLTLLAAGPIYADAVSTGALRRGLTDAGVAETVVVVESRLTVDQLDETDGAVSEHLGATVEGIISRSVLADDTFELAVAGDTGRDGLVEFEWIEAMSDAATIVDGAWPAADSTALEVAVDERIGSELELEVGDELTLPVRSSSETVVTIRVAGWYRIDDPTDLVWQRRPVLLDGVRTSPLFRTVRLLVAQERAVSVGRGGRVTATWVLTPALDRLEPEEIPSVRRGVVGLERRLAAGVEPEVIVETGLPSLLVRNDRSLTVTRSAVVAVIAQLAVLAGYALLLVAGLTVDARSRESAQLRARGASARQLFVLAVIEAAVLVVPVAMLAPTAAAWLLRPFDEFGPLASIGLTIEPQANETSRTIVAIAAVVLVGVLALPAWRAARAGEHVERHHRQSSRSTVQRAGIDIAVVCLAVAAYWQLATLDADRTASIRGRFGVDPLLIVAPTFGLLAGALLVLRAIPPLARAAERGVSRSRSVVASLAAWQMARRPTRYGRAGLLLVTAIAIGTFAVSYEATWSKSQADRAHQEVGSDARVDPNRRTGDSLADLHLVNAHERHGGIERSVPVVRGAATLAGSDRGGVLIAVDAARAQVQGGRGDTESMAAFDLLAAGRSKPNGVELPGRPFRVEMSVAPVVRGGTEGTTEDDDADDSDLVRPPPPLPPVAVFALVVDGAGLFHRADMGTVSLDEPSRVATELVVPQAGGDPITPTYPLTLVDLEFRTSTPANPGREFVLELTDIVTTDADGARRELDLSASSWNASVRTFGFVPGSPSMQRAAQQPDDGIRLEVETGWSSVPSPVVYTVRAGAPVVPQALPAVVTHRWLDESDTAVGDIVAVNGVRSEPVRMEVIGSVESAPTIGLGDEAILVDLPTLQLMTAEPGTSPAAVDEHWLTLHDAPGTWRADLEAPPVESVSVLSERARRSELSSDPAALGIMGALTLGFVAAGVLAVIGFVVIMIVSARERGVEFALLSALGLTVRQLRRSMSIEQVALVVVSALFGTVIGVLLSVLVLPLVSLTQDGAPAFPDVVVIVPWWTILKLLLAMFVGLAISSFAVQRAARRRSIGGALRVGDEG